MDRVASTQWKGSRVWLRVSAATTLREFGHIIDVLEGPRPGEAMQVVIRLEDGTSITVAATDRGTRWDIAV